MARKNNVLRAADGTAVPSELIVGVSLQLVAVPTYSDGSTGEPTTDAEWTLTPAGNGTIPKGLLTLSKTGAVKVTASLSNTDGSKVTSDPVSITGTAAPAAGVTLYSGLSDTNKAETFTEAFLKALTATTPDDGAKEQDLDFTPDATANNGDGTYDVIALPTALTGVKFKSSGFDMPMTKTTTVNIDDTSFDVWVSDNMLTEAHTTSVSWK